MPVLPIAHAATTTAISHFEFVMHPSPEDGQTPAVASRKLEQAFHASNGRASLAEGAIFSTLFDQAFGQRRCNRQIASSKDNEERLSRLSHLIRPALALCENKSRNRK
jgi:hypothetical protein